MSMLRIPRLTLSLVALIAGLHWLVPDKTLLYFNAARITEGETWRIVSGHLVHADTGHLLWNILGLAVLGIIIERQSRALFFAAVLAGIVSVSALLLSPASQLDYYCGLSGVLNSLLLVALWLEWRLSRSLLVAIIAPACLIKVVIEATWGIALMTDVSWPPYAWSHVAGLLGGLFCLWLYRPLDACRPNQINGSDQELRAS